MGQHIDHLFPIRSLNLALRRLQRAVELFPSMSVIENLIMGSYLPEPKRNRTKKPEMGDRAFSDSGG